jgi:hypothetical protein
VAIPAGSGYNWGKIKIKNSITDRVFIKSTPIPKEIFL